MGRVLHIPSQHLLFPMVGGGALKQLDHGSNPEPAPAAWCMILSPDAVGNEGMGSVGGILLLCARSPEQDLTETLLCWHSPFCLEETGRTQLGWISLTSSSGQDAVVSSEAGPQLASRLGGWKWVT